MNALKKILAVSTIAVSAAFISQPANAVVFNPFDAAGSPENITFVTPGYIASYWIEDGTPGLFENASPANVETDSETVTSLALTSATNDRCTGSGREGLGGGEGTNKKCIGNVFTVKINDFGYAIFVYAAALGLLDFVIEVTPGDQGSQGKLSHMDVYNSAPSPVPVPAALPLLMMGVAGLGALARKHRKA